MADDGLGNRDERLRRAQRVGTERLIRENGMERGRAGKMVREAVEKADATKKKLGHW